MKSAGILMLLVTLLTQVALASVSQAQGDEEILTLRAEARWNALIEGGYDRAYQFETPAYRAAFSPRIFRTRLGQAAVWTSAKVTRVDIEGDRATVRIFIEYEALGANGVPYRNGRPIDENWLRVNGEWWHSSKD